VARYQGGNNAGHTVIVGAEEFRFSLLPSGILYPGTICILGNGCVIDPEVLTSELDALVARGRSPDGLRISGNAHLVMPWHRLLDQATELRLGDLQIGTTRRGIGPAYADKASRVGIRVQDLLDEKILRQKIATVLELKNEVLERIYGLDPLDGAEIADDAAAYAERLRPYIADTSLLIAEALERGESVLCEGAQATLLDLDHGTYPFVTSSNPTAGGACPGLGFGPTSVRSVIGVAKAYLTRVGAGPFPSEASPADGERLREAGAEFGVVTGRARRCGWLDLVALRYAARVNGLTELVLTKLDVLSGLAEVPVCSTYRLASGEETSDFPAHQSDFHHAEAVFETLAGWEQPIDDVTSFDALPEAARAYIERVEGAVGVPVSLVGVGQRRDQILARPGAAMATAG
jgi:adenylosuccinate synthase